MSLGTAYFSGQYPWKGMVDVTVDGQAMVYVPKFYVKYGAAPTGSVRAGKMCHWISDHAKTGYHVHPAFINNGAEGDGFYIGKYEASVDASNSAKAASIVNKSPLVSIDFPTMQARCAARNMGTGEQAGWHMENIYEASAISLLALLEYGSTDIQTLIGAGNSNSSAAVATGGTNAVYRGIHEWWGNVWEMVDGLQLQAGKIYVHKNDGSHAYVATGLQSPGSGYPVDVFDVNDIGYNMSDIFMPKTVSATQSDGSFSDYFWSTLSGTTVCYRGGDWVDGASCGLFTLYLIYASSYAFSSIGSRLAKYVV